jgi:hypothetical protein
MVAVATVVTGGTTAAVVVLGTVAVMVAAPVNGVCTAYGAYNGWYDGWWYWPAPGATGTLADVATAGLSVLIAWLAAPDVESGWWAMGAAAGWGIVTGGTLTGTLAGGGAADDGGTSQIAGGTADGLVLPGAAVVAVVGGCNGGCWAGAGDGTGRLGGVGAGTGELLVPLLNGKLGGKAPGNSRFLDAGVEANITELASEPCNKKSYSEKGTPYKKIYNIFTWLRGLILLPNEIYLYW